MRGALIGLARVAAIWLLVCLGCLVVVEGACRLLVAAQPVETYDFRRSRPAAYRDAPYFSRQFVDESEKHQNWLYPKGTHLIIPGDYHGVNFNVENGMRRTTDQPPPPYAGRILLIGASTVYNTEVPDAFTIASYLQRQLREGRLTPYAVFNLGATAVNSAQQVERLKTLTLAPHDIVVFFDGASDVVQGVYYANFDDTLIEENRRRINAFTLRHRTALQELARWSRFADLLYFNMADHLPAHLAPGATRDALVGGTVANMRRNILAGAAIAESAGARFLHVLQPTLFTRRHPTAEERRLVGYYLLNPRGVEESFEAAYPALQRMTRELAEQGIPSYDASGALDTIGETAYLDVWHGNHRAYEAIAQFILAALVDSRLLPVDGAAAQADEPQKSK
jgi:hypothetical protein